MGAKKNATRGYPAPLTNAAGARRPLAGLPSGPTCKDSGDLPDADSFATLIETDGVKMRFGAPSQYAAEMRCVTNDAWHFGYVRD